MSGKMGRKRINEKRRKGEKDLLLQLGECCFLALREIDAPIRTDSIEETVAIPL